MKRGVRAYGGFAAVSYTHLDVYKRQGSEVAKYLSYLLYQLLYIGALAAVVFIYKERPRAFGYRKTSWKYFLIAIALQFGLLFSLDKVNSYFLELLELIGYSGGMSDASSLPSMAVSYTHLRLRTSSRAPRTATLSN